MSNPNPDIPATLDLVDERYFEGASKITSGELAALLRNAADRGAIKNYHVPIVAAGKATSSPGQGPQPVTYGSTYILSFTPGTDNAFRQFKIPSYYVGNPAIHVHWTKTGDLDESTKNVRWKISYSVFDGHGGELTAAPTVVEEEDTYDDPGTTTRILHRTPYIYLDTAPFLAGRYMSVEIEAVTPVGVAMASEPGLFSMDLTFDGYINT